MSGASPSDLVSPATGGSAAAILRWQRVSCSYGDLLAVDTLSLEVMAGEMFGLIGPDGAGKTTSLRLALGLLKPDAGEIEICGLDPHKNHREMTQRVGYLSQRFSLYGDLTVDENIAFFARVHGVKEWKRRRDELLEMVRMTPFRKRLTDRLSGGMKQKLALSCTLIHTPELLILDEPTTGVDPVSRRDFWLLLARLQQQGLTIVMTTPYLDEAERCQRVAMMSHGRLIGVDDPNALRDGFPHVVIELVAKPRRKAVALLRERPDVSHVEAFGERLHAFLPRGTDERPATAGSESGDEAVERSIEQMIEGLKQQGIEVAACRRVTPSLEDVFIASISEVNEESSDEPMDDITEVSA
jgi:ABC-2 type transport system ATP-binding protein